MTEGPLTGSNRHPKGFTDSRRPPGKSSLSWHPDTNTKQFRLVYCRCSVLLSNSPVGPRVLWGTADSLHDALFFKRLERSGYDWTGEARSVHHISCARVVLLPDDDEQFSCAPWQPRRKVSVNGKTRQDDLDTAAGLVKGRFHQTGETHVLVHATNTFAKFLTEVQVRGQPGDARVACVPPDGPEVRQVHHSREPARRLDRDRVFEDLDANVISGIAVRPKGGSLNPCGSRRWSMPSCMSDPTAIPPRPVVGVPRRCLWTISPGTTPTRSAAQGRLRDLEPVAGDRSYARCANSAYLHPVAALLELPGREGRLRGSLPRTLLALRRGHPHLIGRG